MSQITVFLSHHMYLAIALVVILVALLITELLKKSSGPTNLTPAQVAQYMNHKDAIIVDIRSPEKFQQGHILGAKNIQSDVLQLDKKDFAKLLSSKKPEQPLILVCDLGQTSVTHGARLIKAGLHEVYSLRGGVTAWKEEGLPVVK